MSTYKIEKPPFTHKNIHGVGEKRKWISPWTISTTSCIQIHNDEDDQFLGLGRRNNMRKEMHYYIYLLDLQGIYGLFYIISVNEKKLPDGTK